MAKLSMLAVLAALIAVVATFAAAENAPSDQQQHGGCPVGKGLSPAKVEAAQKEFYADVIERFGADSRQAAVFVPADELPAARARAAARPAPTKSAREGPGVSGAELEALTDWAEALKKQSAGDSASGRKLLQSFSVEIPIYINAITDESLFQKVTDAQLTKQLATLNAAYAPWGIQFELAAPFNHATSNDWVALRPFGHWANQMITRWRQGGAGTLNVYVADIASGILGYATFPDKYKTAPETNAVVVNYYTLEGVIENSSRYLGDTLVHEVGHWLGLYHTFQGGCGSSGDQVDDTPRDKKPHYGPCPAGAVRDTCKGKKNPGNDPLSNYMQYSTDACLSEFTAGQMARVAAQWTTYRAGR